MTNAATGSTPPSKHPYLTPRPGIRVRGLRDCLEQTWSGQDRHVWVDVEDPTPEQVEDLKRHFAFNPLALEDALFIPGGIVTTVGLILLVQNATDRFESWAYAWALIPASVGVSMMLYGERTGDPERVRQGRRHAGIFAAVFVIAAVFFEAFIFGDLFGTWLFRTALPLLLIAAGAFLLFRERGGVSSGG